MTILTSLYELTKKVNSDELKDNVIKKVSELKNTASKTCICNNCSKLDIKIVALFDNCIKRRLKAIKIISDEAVLISIAKCETETSVKQAAIERLNTL